MGGYSPPLAPPGYATVWYLQQVKNRWTREVKTAIAYPYYKGSPLCDHGNHNRKV